MIDALIRSYLEPEFVARVHSVDPCLRVHYHPELLPSPRCQADHVGGPLERSPEDLRRLKNEPLPNKLDTELCH